MKKIFIVVGLWAMGCGLGVCNAASEVGVNPSLDKEIMATRRAEMEQKNRELLKSKEWVVYLMQVVVQGKGQKYLPAGTDSFKFTDFALKSKNLSAQGFAESNFNLVTADDGSSTLETMPRTAEGSSAFVKVELKNGVIGGVISIRPPKGAKTIYDFSSVMTSAQPQAAPVTEVAPKKK